MNFKRLIVGFGVLLPLNFCLTSQKALAQNARGVNDNRPNEKVFYYIPAPNRSGTGIGCYPPFGGRWYRYIGNPGFGSTWQIAGTAVLFCGVGGYSEIRPVGCIDDVVPIRVYRRR